MAQGSVPFHLKSSRSCLEPHAPLSPPQRAADEIAGQQVADAVIEAHRTLLLDWSRFPESIYDVATS